MKKKIFAIITVCVFEKFDAGVTYLANENLQFDFSFGTGINKRMNYISVGLSWLILSDEE